MPPALSSRATAEATISAFQQLARDGVILLGHLQSVDDGRIRLAPDLTQDLEFADRFAADFRRAVDDLIKRRGLDLPEKQEPANPEGWPSSLRSPLEIDLAKAGIETVLWATGYRFDFSWIKLRCWMETDSRDRSVE